MKKKNDFPLKIVADNKMRNKRGRNDRIKDEGHTCYRFVEKNGKNKILCKQSLSQKSKVLGLK